jgi:hypothetical protein
VGRASQGTQDEPAGRDLMLSAVDHGVGVGSSAVLSPDSGLPRRWKSQNDFRQSIEQPLTPLARPGLVETILTPPGPQSLVTMPPLPARSGMTYSIDSRGFLLRRLGTLKGSGVFDVERARSEWEFPDVARRLRAGSGGYACHAPIKESR